MKSVKSQSPILNFVKYITLLVLSAGGAVWTIMSDNIVFLIFFVFAAVLSIYKLIYIYTDSMRKVSFMFNSIDCDDYTFKFADNISNVNNYMFNTSLNRIKEILSNAKIKMVEREKYYELIMDSVKTGIVTINDNGNVFQVNGELMRMFGIQIFTHINQLRSIAPELLIILKEIKTGERRQYTLKHEAGETKLAIEASGMIYDGKRLRIISVNDINNALDENEVESWIKLTRILTHEIMNSLAPITSLSETLIDINESGSPAITNGLETIKLTSRSLIAFVESYRKFTRIQTPVKTPFEIKPFLERIVKLICPDNLILIEFNVNPSEIMIYADEDLVNQVVVNIVKNAVQAIATRIDEGEEGFTGKIFIDVSIALDESVLLSISNNGGVIAVEIAKDIFTPFFTTKEHGSGIGLSISRQIMHLHGGSIRVTSNTNDRVTFMLVFR